MSKCKFCGKDAGLMHSVHQECQTKYDTGQTRIAEILGSLSTGTLGSENAKRQVNDIASSSFIGYNALQGLVLSTFENAVTQALSDGILSEKEENRLIDYVEAFGVSRQTLNQNAAYIKLVKGGILRDIMEGEVPKRLSVAGNLPFNFQKSEKLIWLFQNVQYLQPRTHTTYQGRSNGVSIRIAKGLYFRTSQFTGNPVVSTQITLIDTGVLAVTTKHLYFAGAFKSVKARYDKIISFVPYSDALGIQRDSISKSDIFKTDDGWFAYNLVMNLAQFEPA